MEACDHRPEPRNVIWENVTTSKTGRLVRHNIVSLGLVACAFNWSMVMALCEWVSDLCIAWNTETNKWWLAWFYEMLEAYAPILLVNLILCILPFILLFIAKFYERFKFTSEVQQTVFRRYLMFELANIWLALISGTIWTLLELLAEEPVTVLEYITNGRTTYPPASTAMGTQPPRWGSSAAARSASGLAPRSARAKATGPALSQWARAARTMSSIEGMSARFWSRRKGGVSRMPGPLENSMR